MKKVLAAIIFVSLTNLCSQEKVVDTVSLGFKAKLFTVSDFGLAEKDIILNDIQNQKISFLKTRYSDFIFMKIDFSQPHRLPDGSELSFFRDCSYYLAYSVLSGNFLKLGGFTDLDIDDFFRALRSSGNTFLLDFEGGNEIEGIDIVCLYEYHLMSPKKRLKKGFSCLDNCDSKTETQIIQE